MKLEVDELESSAALREEAGDGGTGKADGGSDDGQAKEGGDLDGELDDGAVSAAMPGSAGAVGAGGRGEDAGRVEDGVRFLSGEAHGAHDEGLGGVVRGAREDGGVEAGADAFQGVENGVGDGVAGGSEAVGFAAGGFFDGADAVVDFALDDFGGQEGEVVAVVIRVVFDGVALIREVTEGAGVFGPLEVFADGEEGQGEVFGLGEAGEPGEGRVIDGVRRGRSRVGRGEVVDVEVVGGFVEVDGD